MSHQSQPGQARGKRRKMHGRETENAGSLPRLGSERERQRRRCSNWIRQPSGAASSPHPRPNPRPRRRRGSSTFTKPSSRPPFPSRPSPRAARNRGSEYGAQEREQTGGGIGPNPRHQAERQQREMRGGPKIRPSGELSLIGSTRHARSAGATRGAVVSCCIGIRLLDPIIAHRSMAFGWMDRSVRRVWG